MYYEAKSVNTQLLYKCGQLERIKETLEAAWTAHMRLHQAAELDVPASDVDSSLSQTLDVVGSSISQPATSSVQQLALCRSVSQPTNVPQLPFCRSMSHPTSVPELLFCQPTSVRELPLYRSISQPTTVRELPFCRSTTPVRSPETDDDTTLLSVPRCPHKPSSSTTRQYRAAGDDFLRQFWSDADPSLSIAVRQGPSPSQSNAASKRRNYTGLADFGNAGWMVKQNSDVPADDRHLTTSPQSASSSMIYCTDDVSDVSGHSAVPEPTSVVVDIDQRSVDRSTLRASNDDHSLDLESLFDGDDWWASDQSWRWQCDSPAADVDEASRTLTEMRSAMSPESLLQMNGDANSNFRHHEHFIPLHVEGLVDDSSY